MAFASLSERLQGIMKKISGRGKLSEKDVDAAMREVRLAFLEADVNFKVVKQFIARVKERAVGQEVMTSLQPGQHVVKIVRDELTALMGTSQTQIHIADEPPTVVLLVGLQGAGKTTTIAKLAQQFSKKGQRPLMVAADIYRPAAVKQLQVLGQQIDVPVFHLADADPVRICREALTQCKADGRDVLLIDSAGRLHVDETLMDELENICQAVKPNEIMLVVDSMTGQDAVNVAEAFNEQLGITGVTLTKLDGDARGGAALSIRAVTGTPIKYVTTGEKLDGIEPFHPDRMASRILGMGDMLSLIEKAEQAMDEEKAAEMAKRMQSAQFTLEDFQVQLEQIKNMGPLENVLNMIPGMGKMKQLQGMAVDDKHLDKIQAMINSMTREEKNNPSIIRSSRRKRIASGSGTRVQDVNRLLKQFESTRQMLKKITDVEKNPKKKNKLFSMFR